MEKNANYVYPLLHPQNNSIKLQQPIWPSIWSPGVLTNFSKQVKPSGHPINKALIRSRKHYNLNFPHCLDRYEDLFVNSNYVGLSFSAMRVFVTISKDNVNTVSYTIVEHRFGAASLCESLMLFFWYICYDLE